MPRIDTPELQHLFLLAVKAMYDENASLTDARKAAGKSAMRQYSPGLAYWVFETTLVYAVFKEWSRAGMDVEWEWPYGLHGDGAGDPIRGDRTVAAKKADLVLFEPGNDAPRALFEFKWWNRNTDAAWKAIEADITKMQSWQDKGPGIDRFLIAFWYSPKTSRRSDEEAVKNRLDQRPGARLMAAIEYFDTVVHLPATKREEHWDFAVALVQVDAHDAND